MGAGQIKLHRKKHREGERVRERKKEKQGMKGRKGGGERKGKERKGGGERKKKRLQAVFPEAVSQLNVS